jgi:hypothetical protein
VSAGNSLEPKNPDSHRSEDCRQLRDLTHRQRPSCTP